MVTVVFKLGRTTFRSLLNRLLHNFRTQMYKKALTESNLVLVIISSDVSQKGIKELAGQWRPSQHHNRLQPTNQLLAPSTLSGDRKNKDG